MIRKIQFLFLLSSFMIFSSCYVISHPAPCPGLVEDDSSSEIECSLVVLD